MNRSSKLFYLLRFFGPLTILHCVRLKFVESNFGCQFWEPGSRSFFPIWMQIQYSSCEENYTRWLGGLAHTHTHTAHEHTLQTIQRLNEPFDHQQQHQPDTNRDHNMCACAHTAFDLSRCRSHKIIISSKCQFIQWLAGHRLNFSSTAQHGAFSTRAHTHTHTSHICATHTMHAYDQ